MPSSDTFLSQNNDPSKDILEDPSEAIRKHNYLAEPSNNYSAYDQKELPIFSTSELEIGSLLGKGAFFSVYEITSFHLVQNKEQIKERQISRNFLKIHSHQETSGRCRYAVKTIPEDMIDDVEFYELATRDLVNEAEILRSIVHPNILKIRGFGLSSTRERGTFCLILDRLYDTLKQRIATWRLQDNSHKKLKFRKCLSFRKARVDNIPSDRMKIIVDIAAAMKYLHQKNIIFRDLKPENLGFDVHGDIKLFDFGLARVLNANDKSKDGTYKLSGATGSLRYMAPEVAKYESYNLSADVYSFCIMLWELLTLKKSFEGFSKENHCKLVVYGTLRPKISKSMNEHLQILLKQGWSLNLHDRPRFEDIFTILTEMLSSQEKYHNELQYQRRRSTYVLN